MSRQRRNRRGASLTERKGAPNRLPQLPWRQVINPYPPLAIVSEDELEAIHLASLRILEEMGIELVNDHGLGLFAAAGADVDRATGIVKVDREIIARAVAGAPAQFTLTPRNPERRLTFGGNHVNFTLVAGPPNVHDREGGRRAGNFEDYCNFIRLAQYFNIIHMIGNQVVAPVELPVNTRHLDTYDANLTYSDLVFLATAIGRGPFFRRVQR